MREGETRTFKDNNTNLWKVVPIIIVKVDMRNIGCVVKGDRRGTSKEAEIGGNGGEFVDIVLDVRNNERVLYRREWLPAISPNNIRNR